MRRVFYDRWFILGFLLLLGFSAFSFVAYKKTRSICIAGSTTRTKPEPDEKGIIPWDVLSRQFSSISTN